ncbi:hypothetical protein [Planctomyces sp. SH-PL62]|uniref:hypothetical protein n=1 Tax=Planctomyces sp. SH-PL62 TaxID=1636152 RepID=UPI00078EA30E|nr:hypothetical protein [Planctomyces sp. SH-PL62]AMV40684.1 hypothetical protein VT85_24850 [Planctomyces sp. SH-PL62]
MTMPTPRRRSSILGLMLAVALVAWCLALVVHLRNWEARRVEMYRQRDESLLLLEAARGDLAAAAHPAADFVVRDAGTGRTADWRLEVVGREDRDGRRPAAHRAILSGSNGRLASALAPIRVETFGSPSDVPWLDRLLRAYRERGWRYEVVRLPGAGRLPQTP